MERAVRLTAVITRRNDTFSARAAEVDVAAQGHSVEESLVALREALEVYFEDAALPACDPDGPIIAPVNVRLADE
ncbi:type II toxin-antitoxin system HicB family antitoxin [Frankia sp. CNm7]|uniref:Type II toxin-antitoxin system HicB family antitoxin n=1 Tax=Frankia nepalensis TaxID=1836974 RepID=A0A937UMU9_9ACTN|nr:type II toxin-antitoxin system HicB family antitoxin [Frankia nepalensis]MBL7499191.1 type II toxin-antitoxin system HicB family antitoxin [Frankia nepalensis]MBL7516146.1 type II toxin-antitoxin system HicB family antitoxin [Frankia nepalensis]MBL7519815.1 type II toxin-antitoxin system HicB family antitoxin [Frankia nepalensis]MBL7627242.1 type II toxin-antitoxin system HicB family antitoxin [Frankia nepalensis]